MTFFHRQRRKFIGWIQKQTKGQDKNIRSALKSIAYAYGFYYGGWFLLVLGGLAVLSFTSWLGGPFVAAQVIFFLIVGTLTVVLLNLFWLYRAVKGGIDAFKQDNGYDNVRDVNATNAKRENSDDITVIESSGNS